MRPEDHELLIVDGACGTNLHAMHLPPSAWAGKDGCNEALNLSCPEAIEALHRSFVEAGAQVLETNTFGASRIVLEEYGLGNRVAAINEAAVAIARRACAGREGLYVAGSIGPTTKLPTLGHVDRDTLYAAYVEQSRTLIEAGVDLLIIETGQDLLQVKTAVLACLASLEKAGSQAPLMVSVTVERAGTMLVGSDVAAAAVALEPFPLFSFGLNCATGPDDMESHIRLLAQIWPGRLSCMPNQGLPEIRDGNPVYPLAPDAFAQRMARFVSAYGVRVVGGCCGTTPEHIRSLAVALRGIRPGGRSPTA